MHKVSGTVQNKNLLIHQLFAIHYYFTGQPSQIHKAPTLLSPVCQALTLGLMLLQHPTGYDYFIPFLT